MILCHPQYYHNYWAATEVAGGIEAEEQHTCTVKAAVKRPCLASESKSISLECLPVIPCKGEDGSSLGLSGFTMPAPGHRACQPVVLDLHIRLSLAYIAREVAWVLGESISSLGRYIISHQQRPGTAVSHCSQGVIKLHRPSLLPAATPSSLI